jgi:phosphate transport system protein
MARASFQQELEQLRLQVEVMAAQVGVALERMHDVLRTGDVDLADRAVAADDHVDAMLVSLTERTYDMIRRQAPVASDLRYLVSVLRVLEELERVGDLSLRVVKQVAEQPLLASHARLFDILDHMASVAEALFRVALDAWAAQDASLADDLVGRSAAMDDEYRALLDEILGLGGPNAVHVAITAVLVGRALERIADHTVIVGERLRYLLTGDPAYLASEVR